ncbi:phosphomevalonate kinase [Streptococcus castoreus]|uniref:phosphomevalonate kinase n=1 Tax=Streptococcus castoreus TaxID=254786 RepID=UPI00041CF547|nr:phosphomevalonate kinase [Streptococcus castoreus]
MSSYLVQTGGKLYLTGEYAILIPGQTALIHYIPIMMTAVIAPSDSICLTSDMFNYTVDMTPDKSYGLIQAAIKTFADYLGISIGELQSFSLSITGKLEREGKKFGIGSSGSVTVLTLKALAAYYQLVLGSDLLFKLASYTLLKQGDNGSMGDIACIAYQQLVAFTSFDRKKVSGWLQNMTLQEILHQDWGYRIQPIFPILSCDFLVGWTKVPSMSSQMIQQVKAKITSRFLEMSQQMTQEAISALQFGRKQTLKESLQKAGQLLNHLDAAIYHPKLIQLVEACQDQDAVAKSSGSGGGDCGIALVFDETAREAIISRWQEADIVLLYQEKWGRS